MRIFRFSLNWNKDIDERFDQDDTKTIGHRRVQSLVTVVAPDKDLAELFLKRSFHFKQPVFTLLKEEDIHVFVQGSGVTTAMLRDDACIAIGPDELNDLGQRLKGARR